MVKFIIPSAPIFKIKKISKFFYFIILIFLSFIGVKALFHKGFYTSHDGRHQIIRLMHFHQALVDGQIPPRWAGTAFKGYGYPLFIFTYRLPFWLAEFWYLFSKDLGEAIKFVFIITYFLSGVSFFVFASKIWKSKAAALFSSIIYLWAPYRFVNIFVRASLGEAVSFMFIPLIFLGIYLLAFEEKNFLKGWFMLVFSLSGLILSHMLVVYLWLIPFLGWFLWCFFMIKGKKSSKKRKNFIFESFLAGIFVLFLTAYYWLPAAGERKYIKVSSAIGSYYKAHFVSLKQLIYSKWGYGFSMPGVNDDMMSFQLGVGQWLVFFVSLFLVGMFFLRKINFFKKFFKDNFIFDSYVLLIISYFLVIFLLSIYLMLSPSEWFYRLTNKFLLIDIPWRFLGVAIFCVSVLLGGVIKSIKNGFLKAIFSSMVLFLVFYGNRNHLRVNQYVYYNDQEYWQSTETSNEYEDYAPRDFVSAKFNEQDPNLLTLSGSSVNKIIERKSNLFRFYSEVKSKEAQVVAKVAYYPGWKVLINGKEEKPLLEDGRIKVKLNKGNHLITLRFGETKLRLFSNWLSLLTLIFLFVWGVINFKIKRYE